MTRLTNQVGSVTDPTSLQGMLAAANANVTRLTAELVTANGRATTLTGQLTIARDEAASLRRLLTAAQLQVADERDRADQAETTLRPRSTGRYRSKRKIWSRNQRAQNLKKKAFPGGGPLMRLNEANTFPEIAQMDSPVTISGANQRQADADEKWYTHPPRFPGQEFARQRWP